MKTASARAYSLMHLPSSMPSSMPNGGRARLTMFEWLIVIVCTIPHSTLSAQQPQTTQSPSATISPVQQPSESPAEVKTDATPPPPGPSTLGTTPLTIDQIRANLPAAPAEQFEFLRRQRKVTLEALDETSAQVKTLTTNMTLLQKRKDSLSEQQQEIPTMSSKGPIEADKKHLETELTQATQALDDAKVKHASDAELQRLQSNVQKIRERLDIDDYHLTRLAEQEKKQQELDASIKAIENDLSKQVAHLDRITQQQSSYQRLLGEIDDMVNKLFISSDATNKFKFEMSAAFAGLVAIVIIGFFWISFTNDDVKKAIFSSEAGIQFITLFALVIAIILFGIIGILESKELSALLGGLSGYILGRGKSP